MRRLYSLISSPVTSAAVISGLGIYCPIPVVRGAIFGIFPGIAQRSWRMILKGLGIGALFELGYVLFWEMTILPYFNIVWDPRWGCNAFLTGWLPGTLSITHSGSIWPHELQFVVGLLVWFNVAVLSWWVVWKPKIPGWRTPVIFVITDITVTIACIILLIVSPMDHRWPCKGAPFADLHGIPWIIVYLSAFPVCCVIIGMQFRRLSQNI